MVNPPPRKRALWSQDLALKVVRYSWLRSICGIFIGGKSLARCKLRNLLAVLGTHFAFSLTTGTVGHARREILVLLKELWTKLNLDPRMKGQGPAFSLSKVSLPMGAPSGPGFA